MTVTNLFQIKFGKTKNVDMSAKIQEHMGAKKGLKYSTGYKNSIG